MQLEAAEVDVPPPPSGPNKGRPVALFFRVLSIEPDLIRVELWERGVYYGARNVSISSGSARLKARRIALAAAVLVRRLERQRIAEARRLAELEPSPAELEAQRLGQQLRAGIGASGVAAWVGTGDFWLAGPSLSGELRLAQHARLDIGAAWLMGAAPELAGAPTVQWLELSLLPAYSTPLAPRFKLLMGARFAAAAVHVSDVHSVDAVPTEEDSWSARAAGVLRFEPQLGAGSDPGRRSRGRCRAAAYSRRRPGWRAGSVSGDFGSAQCSRCRTIERRFSRLPGAVRARSARDLPRRPSIR